MKKNRSIPAIIAMCLVGISLVPVVYLAFLALWPDQRMRDHSDLELPEVEIGRLVNTPASLRLTKELVFQLSRDEKKLLKKWGRSRLPELPEVDKEGVAALLADSEQRLAVLQAAVDGGGVCYYAEKFADTSYLKHYRVASQLLSIRSRIRLLDEDVSGAISDALTVLRFAKMLERSSGDFRFQNDAENVFSHAYQALIDLEASSDLSRGESELITSVIYENRPDLAEFRKGVLTLYHDNVNQCDEMAREGLTGKLIYSPQFVYKLPGHRLFYHPNRTVNTLSEVARSEISKLQEVPYLKEMGDLVVSRDFDLLKLNGVGLGKVKMYDSMLRISRYFYVERKLAGDRLLVRFAAKSFRSTHGQDITSTNQLIPDFLSEVPINLLTGEPITLEDIK